MTEHIVNCGCGRTMALDALRGRGAYRCGCGARVRITTRSTAVSTGCSVDNCRGVSVTGKEIRLCVDHRDQAVILLAREIGRREFVHLGRLYDQGAERWEAPVIPVYEGPAVATTEEAAIVRQLPLDGPHNPVVYFLLNGDRVKIGYTTNLKSRLIALSLRVQNVILLLDGGQKLEYALHSRFRYHRIDDTEWFHYAEELQEFVKARPQVGRGGSRRRNAPPPRKNA
ncbi:GIY-YIG nuclease family protein [Streptomyces sp. DH37]|uniref:GIY-YIG nuclease family protein n=1 Tax=Streptomyces sp. DH37 TaxID=3040122 RepID=UPI0024432FF4|nr:GIY-YIG nuclease family protein [Streptomyces sp. DH37]MDG9701677.1 GIY-YIG nuclease family protein [Streptomyces sp. DH37]